MRFRIRGDIVGVFLLQPRLKLFECAQSGVQFALNLCSVFGFFSGLYVFGPLFFWYSECGERYTELFQDFLVLVQGVIVEIIYANRTSRHATVCRSR